jgi:DNA invertase Pin-like site-specific DNA recombinase
VDNAGYLRVVVRQAGAEVIATDATGSRLEGRIKDVLGEQERDEIRARTKRALAEKKAAGQRISRHPPFGYRHTRGGQVVADDREQHILRRLRALRAKGATYAAMAAALAKMQPRKGTKQWYPATIRKVLLASPAKRRAEIVA